VLEGASATAASAATSTSTAAASVTTATAEMLHHLVDELHWVLVLIWTL
jgi:hypothetical protein